MHRILKFLLIILTLGCTQRAVDNNQSDRMESLTLTENPLKIPPFSPSDDEVIVENVQFSEICEAETVKTLPNSPIEYSVVTQSNYWGFIWRADIIAVNGGKGRIVCWSPPETDLEGVVLNSKFLDENDAPLP